MELGCFILLRSDKYRVTIRKGLPPSVKRFALAGSGTTAVKYGEFVLAVGITLWAVLLALPGESFQRGSAFYALGAYMGGEYVLTAIVALLAIGAWAGLYLSRWPPRWRCWTVFCQMLWWVFVSANGAMVRPQSAAWATAVMPAILAYYVWIYLRQARARCLYVDKKILKDEE